MPQVCSCIHCASCLELSSGLRFAHIALLSIHSAFMPCAAFKQLPKRLDLPELLASWCHSWLVRAVNCSVLCIATTPTDDVSSMRVQSFAEQVEDDDEVLMIMAEQLGGFVELMGGNAQAAVLVDILGSLATVEETIVRDKVSYSRSHAFNCVHFACKRSVAVSYIPSGCVLFCVSASVPQRPRCHLRRLLRAQTQLFRG